MSRFDSGEQAEVRYLQNWAPSAILVIFQRRVCDVALTNL
jgi:hypothetical protein